MSSELEDRITDAMKARLDLVRGGSVSRGAMASRIRRRRSARWGGAGLAVAVMTAGILVLPQTRDSSPASSAGAGQSTTSTLRAAGDQANGQAVASGEHHGRPWTLFGYATQTPAVGTGVVGDFCHAFRFGRETPGSDYSCGVSDNGPLTPPQFVAPVWFIPENGPNVFYGRVSAGVAELTVEVPDGQRFPGRIYDAPAEWGAQFELFVAFVPPTTDEVVVVARDAAGNELERREMDLGANP